MISGLRKVIFPILLLSVAYVAYQYMIKPANQHLAEQNDRVQAKLEKLKKLEKATTAAENLSKQLEQLQEAIEFFESKLPPKSKIYKVLEQVTVIALKQGLKPKTIRTRKQRIVIVDNRPRIPSGKIKPNSIRYMLNTNDNGGYIEQPLKMELVGDFNSFYSFLLEIEKLPRIMKIRELKLKKQTGYEGQIVADFIVSIFFQNKTG